VQTTRAAVELPDCRIKGLPPGTYAIEVVHEHWLTQPQDQTITVGAKDSKTQDFTLKG